MKKKIKGGNLTMKPKKPIKGGRGIKVYISPNGRRKLNPRYRSGGPGTAASPAGGVGEDK